MTHPVVFASPGGILNGDSCFIPQFFINVWPISYSVERLVRNDLFMRKNLGDMLGNLYLSVMTSLNTSRLFEDVLSHRKDETSWTRYDVQFNAL